MMGSWNKADRGTSGSRGRRTKCRPALERLEGRELLTDGTQPYLLTGDRWSNATPITFSIAPDGVMWDRRTNVLNATMDARFATDAWQDEVARALQTWASVADLDFARVDDSTLAFDAVGKAQGDARFGDIRFGGYNFGDARQLAHAYNPPPNGSTGAGDVAVNTATVFNIGSEFDLYSVLLHETGHSLGLEHPDNPDAVMLAVYNGVRAGLDAGDIAGIRAIYGARADDIYGQQGRGSGLADAVDVSAGRVSPSLFALKNLSLTAVGDSDYFSVVAPTSGASLRVTAIAGGVSMLSARVSVYDASGALLGHKGDASIYGQDVLASVAGVVAGQRYYIKVAGATDDVFAVGSYRLQVAFVEVEPPVAATASPVESAVASSPVGESGPLPAGAIVVASHPVPPPVNLVSTPSVPVAPSIEPVPTPLAPTAIPPASPTPPPLAAPPSQPAAPVVSATQASAVIEVEPLPAGAIAAASHQVTAPGEPVITPSVPTSPSSDAVPTPLASATITPTAPPPPPLAVPPLQSASSLPVHHLETSSQKSVRPRMRRRRPRLVGARPEWIRRVRWARGQPGPRG